MKKYLSAVAAVFIILAAGSFSALSAADMSAGVYTWYAWWDFPEDTGENVTVDPGLVYGPTFSVNIDETLSLTFVFLYGEFNAEGVNNNIPVNDFTYNIKRYDGDTALNYRLNTYFKLYLGAKYSAYKYNLKGNVYDGKFDHGAFGPAAGVSFTVPMLQNIFFIGNAGGLYLMGNETNSDTLGNSGEFKIKDYGYNTGLSLAWYIEPASTTISLGGRYQYIKIKYDDGFSNSSRFYGITLSAAYLFSI